MRTILPLRKRYFLYSTVSSLLDRSKRFTLCAFPDRPVHSDTNSASPGSMLARQQLRANTKSLTCPPLSKARYSFIQLSQQGRQWRERKCPIFETVAKGDSNPGSLGCESGILPLSYRAPCVTVNIVALLVGVSSARAHPVSSNIRIMSGSQTGYLLFTIHHPARRNVVHSGPIRPSSLDRTHPQTDAVQGSKVHPIRFTHTHQSCDTYSLFQTYTFQIVHISDCYVQHNMLKVAITDVYNIVL